MNPVVRNELAYIERHIALRGMGATASTPAAGIIVGGLGIVYSGVFAVLAGVLGVVAYSAISKREHPSAPAMIASGLVPAVAVGTIGVAMSVSAGRAAASGAFAGAR